MQKSLIDALFINSNYEKIISSNHQYIFVQNT